MAGVDPDCLKESSEATDQPITPTQVDKLTADVLARINEAAQKLKEAQLQADTYLSGISQVLTSAHHQFGTQVIGTLNSVNGEFHTIALRKHGLCAHVMDTLREHFARL